MVKYAHPSIMQQRGNAPRVLNTNISGTASSKNYKKISSSKQTTNNFVFNSNVVNSTISRSGLKQDSDRINSILFALLKNNSFTGKSFEDSLMEIASPESNTDINIIDIFNTWSDSVDNLFSKTPTENKRTNGWNIFLNQTYQGKQVAIGLTEGCFIKLPINILLNNPSQYDFYIQQFCKRILFKFAEDSLSASHHRIFSNILSPIISNLIEGIAEPLSDRIRAHLLDSARIMVSNISAQGTLMGRLTGEIARFVEDNFPEWLGGKPIEQTIDNIVGLFSYIFAYVDNSVSVDLQHDYKSYGESLVVKTRDFMSITPVRIELDENYIPLITEASPIEIFVAYQKILQDYDLQPELIDELINARNNFIQKLIYIYKKINKLHDWLLSQEGKNSLCVLIPKYCGPKFKIYNPFDYFDLYFKSSEKLEYKPIKIDGWIYDSNLSDIFVNLKYGPDNSYFQDDIKDILIGLIPDINLEDFIQGEKLSIQEVNTLRDLQRQSLIQQNKKVWAELNENTCECSECPEEYSLCEPTEINPYPFLLSITGNKTFDHYNDCLKCCDENQTLIIKNSPETTLKTVPQSVRPPEFMIDPGEARKIPECECSCNLSGLTELLTLMPCKDGCSEHDIQIDTYDSKNIIQKVVFDLFIKSKKLEEGMSLDDIKTQYTKFVCASPFPPDAPGIREKSNLIKSSSNYAEFLINSDYEWDADSCEWICKNYKFKKNYIFSPNTNNLNLIEKIKLDDCNQTYSNIECDESEQFIRVPDPAWNPEDVSKPRKCVCACIEQTTTTLPPTTLPPTTLPPTTLPPTTLPPTTLPPTTLPPTTLPPTTLPPTTLPPTTLPPETSGDSGTSMFSDTNYRFDYKTQQWVKA